MALIFLQQFAFGYLIHFWVKKRTHWRKAIIKALAMWSKQLPLNPTFQHFQPHWGIKKKASTWICVWTNYIQTIAYSLYTHTHTHTHFFSHFTVYGSVFTPQDESLQHRVQVSSRCSMIWVTAASLELKTKATVLWTFTSRMLFSYLSHLGPQQQS